jgi:hypothetical protein
MVGDYARFGPGRSFGGFIDRPFRRHLREADALVGPARLAAYARLEDGLLRGAAPVAAFASFVAPEYFSARSGCRLVQGAYNFTDLGALCISG